LKDWADKVNGFGVLLRFIFPVMLGLLAWSLKTNLNDLNHTISRIEQNQEQVKRDLEVYQEKSDTYNMNHLEHHRISELLIAERLACIETELKRLR
jgi:hypothetical protein